MRSAHVTAIAALSAATFAGSAQALTIDSLTVFGDSNVDIGRAAAPESYDGDGIVPPPNTVGGRSADGRIIPEFLAERLGVPQLNFAWGGAQSGPYNIIAPLLNAPDTLETGLSRQIDEFAGGLAGETANPDSLYVVWAGSNDLYGRFFGPEPTFEILDKADEATVRSMASQATANLEDAVADLTALGARNIVVATRTTRPVLSDSAAPWDLPDLDPATEGVQNPELNDASGNYLNALIRDLVPQLDSVLASNVLLFDDDLYIRDIIAASGGNGFLPYSEDPSQFCVNQADGMCDDLINYDGAHKTSAVHSVLADDFIARFDLEGAPAPAPVPLPASGAVLLGGLAGLAWLRRKHDRSGV